MWYSSVDPSKSIPHQVPSLNHSLLCVFEAVGPCGQGLSDLTGLCSPKATPVSKTSAPTPATSVVHTPCPRTILVPILASCVGASRLGQARSCYTAVDKSVICRVAYLQLCHRSAGRFELQWRKLKGLVTTRSYRGGRSPRLEHMRYN